MSQKILIVDDDPITPLVVEKYLKSQGYTPTVANSAVEASKLMKESYFDLVVTDINMPEVNGLEFMFWIKQNFHNCKVIIMTAFGSDEIKNFAKSHGAVNYFEKPIDLKELNKEIQIVLRQKLGITQELVLKDILQMIAISGQKKVISISDPIKNKTGFIYMRGMFPIHAEYGELYGEEAFFEILKEEHLMFYDLDWLEPPVKSINKTIDILLSDFDLKYPQKKVEVEQKENTSESQALIKAENKLLVRKKEQEEALKEFTSKSNIREKLTIYESGVVMGITVGKTTKEEVVSIMKEFSKTNVEKQKNNQMIIFDDITVTFLFSENETVEEVHLGKFYKGKTDKGIGVGNTISEAIEIYGKPRICTIKGAIWDNIAFYSEENSYITSIKLRNVQFFS